MNSKPEDGGVQYRYHHQCARDMGCSIEVAKETMCCCCCCEQGLKPIANTLQAVYPDLAAFRPVEKLLAMIFCAVSITFSIVDFNALVYPNSGRNSTIKFINDEELFGMEYWRRVVMCLSGIASFTGVLGVVLTTKRKRSNYFWGLINSCLYGIYAFAYGYAGDAQLFIIFFVPMQIVGMYTWDKEGAQDGTNAVVKSLSWNMAFFYFVVLWVIGIGFYFEIPAFAAALNGYYIFDPATIGTYAPLILDASSNAFNVVAQILMIHRYWQQWLCWIAVDCIQIAMWSGISTFPADFNILVMWTLFLINALCGLFVWYTSQEGSQQVAAATSDGTQPEQLVQQPDQIRPSKSGEDENYETMAVV